MKDQLACYESFYIREDAENLQGFFLEHDLICVLDFSEGYFDLAVQPTLDKDKIIKTYRILMSPALFSKADELQMNYFEKGKHQAPEDYPLYEFSDLELFAVLEHFDQWSKFDVFMARKILANRGLPVDSETFEMLKAKRISTLKMPNQASKQELIGAYVGVFMGGFWAVFQGLDFLGTKVLPNGQKVPAFDEITRNHGKILLITGTIAALIWLVLIWMFWR